MSAMDLVRQLIGELEARYGTHVKLRVEVLNPHRELSDRGESLDIFVGKEIIVTPMDGKGTEYQMARDLAGTYPDIRELTSKINEVEERRLRGPQGRIDFDLPMNIRGLKARMDGLYAVIDGRYGERGVLEPHPGFEGSERPYDLKVAEIVLRDAK